MSAEIRPIRTAAEVALLEAFPRFRAQLSGAAAVLGQREEAFRRFEAQGLPHRRVEEWKYTDLRALMREAKPLATLDREQRVRARSAGQLLAGVEARRLVIANGAFVPEASDLAGLEPGLSIVPMATALEQGDRFVAEHLGRTVPSEDIALSLNTAFMTDGVVIRVAPGAKIARPIHLAFAYVGTSAGAVFTRSLIALGAEAEVTLIESHEGPESVDYQVNNALEFVVGDHARLERIKIGRDGAAALHLSTLMARVGEGAEVQDFAFTAGGAVTRNQLFVRLAGEGIVCGVRGANLLKGRQHVDSTMVIDHAAGGCSSRELFKSVLQDQGRAVFQGKIIVQPDAQKTDGKMMTQALLLSEDAEADNKPELEIFADDVQCGHGATVGALDEELLFYLQARGIPLEEAQGLLIQSFVGEAIEAVSNEDVREILVAATQEWLTGRRS